MELKALVPNTRRDAGLADDPSALERSAALPKNGEGAEAVDSV